MILKNASDCFEAIAEREPFVIYNGHCQDLLTAMPERLVDLTVTSPPYFMGKAYDYSYKPEDFLRDHVSLAPLIERATRVGGSVCWQTGYHVKSGVALPLDFLAYQAFAENSALTLRNRIIWTFGHGAHCVNRLSGRHETVLWFTRGDKYHFELDAIRVPQKYPGKRHYKGPKRGEYSGNPLGKNPSDVWVIPNVNAHHVEKTLHPCQFPVELAQRLVRALTKKKGVVFDPFAGVASTGIAAAIEGRRFLGAEISREYAEISLRRYQQLKAGELRVRPMNRPLLDPKDAGMVGRAPPTFAR